MLGVAQDFILPTDVIVADKFAADAATQTVSVESIPEGWMGLDNGPEATKMIQDKLSDCKTIIWNGPMGVFEFEAFAKGTFDIADTLAELTESGCACSAALKISRPHHLRCCAVRCRGVVRHLSHLGRPRSALQAPPSLAAVTRSRLSRRPASLRRCRTSRPAAALRSSCSRARCSRVSRRCRRRKRFHGGPETRRWVEFAKSHAVVCGGG
jgi:3-phosphoglycerate kinase